MTRFQTIVADPPWEYEGFASQPGDPRRTDRKVKAESLPYSAMTLEAIAALPVASLAAPDAFLFLWTTNRYLYAADDIAAAWGFEYRQMLVWHKTGNPSPFGGTLAPNHAEFLLVAVKGTPKAHGRLPGSVIAAPKPYEHSRKPDVFIDLIERVAPGPYVEMFARRARFGWEYWGDQSLGTVEMPEAAA